MYACLKNQRFNDTHHYSLVPLRYADMEDIRQWRNAQMEVLRQQKLISKEQQVNYYQTVINPTFSQQEPPQILFSFLWKEVCIGYGGLTHIDWESKRGEISFLLSTDRIESVASYQRDFSHFLKLLFKIAFEDLQLHRLFTETFAFRKDHIAVLEACGLKKEGVLRDHIFKADQWHASIMHGILATEYSSYAK